MWRVNKIGFERIWYESELIEQIKKECNEAISIYDQEDFFEDDCDRFLGESCMAQKILEIIENFESEE